MAKLLALSPNPFFKRPAPIRYGNMHFTVHRTFWFWVNWEGYVVKRIEECAVCRTTSRTQHVVIFNCSVVDSAGTSARARCAHKAGTSVQPPRRAQNRWPRGPAALAPRPGPRAPPHPRARPGPPLCLLLFAPFSPFPVSPENTGQRRGRLQRLPRDNSRVTALPSPRSSPGNTSLSLLRSHGSSMSIVLGNQRHRPVYSIPFLVAALPLTKQ